MTYTRIVLVRKHSGRWVYEIHMDDEHGTIEATNSSFYDGPAEAALVATEELAKLIRERADEMLREAEEEADQSRSRILKHTIRGEDVL